MRLAFRIALRFLKSSKGQTILISLGIAIGVSVQVFIGSLIQGLQKGLIEKTIGSSSQITVVPGGDDTSFANWKNKLEIAKASDPGIKVASATADSSAYAVGQSNSKTLPVVVRGMTLADAEKIYKFTDRLLEGSIPASINEVLIGKELKDELKLSLSDELALYLPGGAKYIVKVTGFYDLKVSNVNKTWVVTQLETAQQIFGLDQNVTALEMQVEDVFAADTIASTIEKALNDNHVKVLNWKAQNQELLSGLSGQSMSSLLIQIFVLVAVVLGIASVLAISVLQKSKQLGILKAMGIKDRTASQIFLFQGVMLGIIGAVLGILLGLGLSWSFTKFALNPDGTPVVALYIDMKFIAVSGVIAALSATIASLIPAIKSSRLNPIEVIKNG